MNDDTIQVRKLKNIIQSSVIFVEETVKKKFDCQVIFCHLALNKKKNCKKVFIAAFISAEVAISSKFLLSALK